MTDQSKCRVLFVCMGNICRSPTAEGVFRQLVREYKLEQWIETDSAGTHSYHIGRGPDARSQVAAKADGIDISDLRARQVAADDYAAFDWILAMDDANMANMLAECPPEHAHKLHRFMDFAPERKETEVPDPYFGHGDGFKHVLQLVQAASDGLLARIREHGQPGQPGRPGEAGHPDKAGR